MINECLDTRYKVKGTWPNSNSTLDWPVDTLGEAKAFIDGFNLSDSSRIKDFKIIEIRTMKGVVSVHTSLSSEGQFAKEIVDVDMHNSEKEAEAHLEYLKKEGEFDEDIDNYDWHIIRMEVEVEVNE